MQVLFIQVLDASLRFPLHFDVKSDFFFYLLHFASQLLAISLPVSECLLHLTNTQSLQRTLDAAACCDASPPALKPYSTPGTVPDVCVSDNSDCLTGLNSPYERLDARGQHVAVLAAHVPPPCTLCLRLQVRAPKPLQTSRACLLELKGVNHSASAIGPPSSLNRNRSGHFHQPAAASGGLEYHKTPRAPQPDSILNAHLQTNSFVFMMSTNPCHRCVHMCIH